MNRRKRLPPHIGGKVEVAIGFDFGLNKVLTALIRPDKSMKMPPRPLTDKDRAYLRPGTSKRRMDRRAVA